MFAGAAIRSESNGYSGDSVRQKFGSKERDIETGLDFFEARYFSSIQGRFTSPDDFWKDSQTDDPQSWNKYAYVHNNPLKYIDPTGEKVTVTIETDEEHRRGIIRVTATIGIYADGSNVDLNKAAKQIESEIETAWSGTFEKDGITYTVTTDVTVNIRKDEADAAKNGDQNAIALYNGGNLGKSETNARPFLGGPDTGRWNAQRLDTGTAQHEFTHLLGVDDQDGPNLSRSRAPAGERRSPDTATRQDYLWAMGGTIDFHRGTSRKDGIRQPDPRGMVLIKVGPPRSRSYTYTLRPPYIWWR
jgi:RHS repeat-associated protein